MSCRAGPSVSRVRYSVRNCWSTEMPNRYNLVAPSGMPRVTTVKAASRAAAPIRATRRGRGAQHADAEQRDQAADLTDRGQRATGSTTGRPAI